MVSLDGSSFTHSCLNTSLTSEVRNSNTFEIQHGFTKYLKKRCRQSSDQHSPFKHCQKLTGQKGINKTVSVFGFYRQFSSFRVNLNPKNGWLATVLLGVIMLHIVKDLARHWILEMLYYLATTVSLTECATTSY